eukprot:2836407-Lingulodinium_polyedra.AAC.1
MPNGGSTRLPPHCCLRWDWVPPGVSSWGKSVHLARNEVLLISDATPVPSRNKGDIDEQNF